MFLAVRFEKLIDGGIQIRRPDRLRNSDLLAARRRFPALCQGELILKQNVRPYLPVIGIEVDDPGRDKILVPLASVQARRNFGSGGHVPDPEMREAYRTGEVSQAFAARPRSCFRNRL